MQQVTKVALVGCPNVGKSVLFNYLTGAYVTVSNYPGTTIDISKGRYRYQEKAFEIVDTPGIYSILPFTDEERVTREFLEHENLDIAIHVIDAKNLLRMLPLTIQLIEAGLPVLLVVNLMDEAEEKGIYINEKRLSDRLGIPVVLTAATKKIGLERLKRSIAAYCYKPPAPFYYSPYIEECIELITADITHDLRFSKRATAILLLQGDPYALSRAGLTETAGILFNSIYRCLDQIGDNPDYLISTERQLIVDEIVSFAIRQRSKYRQTAMEQLGRAAREPLLGIPILLFVLYFGLYKFVGRFGAGFLVDYIDKTIFASYITPAVEAVIHVWVQSDWLQSLLIGEYGVYSLGFRYAVVIVLPIVGTFFLMFAILEDCGYLPRLAMLVDGIFKRIGLNGRAVIPLTLGLGCGTMAVMVTRTLETKRERILSTLLLSLAIPCSAQLGVVLALLSHNVTILTIWLLYIGSIFLLTGWLASLLLPGSRSPFYMELPPLRIPVLSNIIKKAYTRMLLYFTEILPVFVITSLLLWLGDQFGLLEKAIASMAPIMKLLGLPSQTADIFLLGFFRRDYGAAGLYDMAKQGLLTDFQLLVSAITLTLFVPCVAQFMVMIKERGLAVSVILVLLILGIAFGSGMLIHILFRGMV